MDYTSKAKSSAFEVYSINSEVIGSPYCKRQFVSAKYKNRRRYVNFKIPETESLKSETSHSKSSQFADYENNNNSVGLKNDIFGIQESDDEGPQDLSRAGPRRMSAPELPPISGKSTLVSNGYTRNNTFFLSKPDRKSIHSDSSIQGYRLTTQSRTSSSSSQKSRGRVLSAGAGSRTSKQTLTAELPKATNQSSLTAPKQATYSIMRNGASTAVAQRCPSSVISRAKTKMSFKDMSSTPRTSISHSKSEAQINGRMRSSNSEVNMRRNNSDRSLADSKILNKNNQNNNSTNKRNANINGIRRYASTNALNNRDERRSDDDVVDKDPLYDSDTDSEKDQRVLEWVIGVAEIAEPPEEPLIEHTDEPPQRDTAIRIVYDGDS
ncbi:hypothetical protein ACF0H5_022489 [Mactra antiquata]